jgi:hypothetical protein
MSRLRIVVLGTLWASAAWAAPFTYQPAGTLTPGSGKGLVTSKVYAPGIRYPIEKSPSYPNSQVWGVGGMNGPKGSACDLKNYSYPWWDNYCETRSWSMPLCPAGKGHQGQDIRAATCDNKKWWSVATEDGTITSIGSYSVYLKGKSGTTFRYLHMDPASVKVKVGQKVSKGQQLGLVSNAMGGTPTTVHLHFDVEQYVSGVGTVFVSPYNSLVESYQNLIEPNDPCATANCDDGNPCTQDSCAKGNCSHAPTSGGCDDGDACTAGDTCVGGACKGGAAKTCDDGKPCTADSCSKGTCKHTSLSGPCSDGDACTSGEQCSDGVCGGGLAKNCNDGQACTTDSCVGGVCQHTSTPGACGTGPCTSATTCDDNNGCTVDTCESGQCAHVAKTGACDDGDPCTEADTCQSGACAGKPNTCDDDNPCTVDACAAGQCGHLPGGGPCDDGDGCTVGDACALGNCMSGAPNPCDDGLDCTLDSCASGSCQHSGATQPEQRTCVDASTVSVFDACGAGPKLEECPADQPCLAGVCGGPASGADGGGLDAGDAAAGGAVTLGAPVSPSSGCGTTTRPGSSAGVLCLLAILAHALRTRRRPERP